MRILQIIDSLEAGGAESMAVNYANALAKNVAFSGLVSTREEGPLVQQLDGQVSYLHLNKKSAFDLGALFRLRNFVKMNNVAIVQAHSSSFFIAFLLKLICPSIKLIWQDHYGDSEFLNKRASLVFRITMPFFDGIIAVNQKLKNWSTEVLNFKNVIYLPNFSGVKKEVLPATILKGIPGKRIVLLANLRVQKNHFLVLEVARKIKEFYPGWSFHLIGKDFNDAYSRKIKNLISAYKLDEMFFLYGTRQDIGAILEQANIGILSSKSEGLPVALLEYGFHKKPVVVTNVGDISEVIKNRENGFIVNAEEEEAFYKAVAELISDDNLKITFGNELYKTVTENFSEGVVVKKYLNWLQSTILK
ncbi:glycosyltransferase family 4 protein [Flavobacterium sp. W22_SRS_FP1]|uniref:glycosyltransferase family 4 protein n=1 Tax=Flavobacterium sp. W22_SRS_FP1 TaxID=3240276 RepID=UPI003F8FDC3E